MSGNIIELINETAISNINKLIWYSLTVTVVAIIAITKTQKEFMRYKMWKKDTIKILGFTREWEATPDAMLQQLWDENQRLEAEVKVLTKKYTNLSFISFVMATLLLIWLYFTVIFRNNPLKKK
jgi:hypothetical protein